MREGNGVPMARYTDPPMLTKKSTANEDSADRETIKDPTQTKAGPYRIALDNSGAFTSTINSNRMIGIAYASSLSSTSIALSSCAITAATISESTKRTP